MKKKFYKMDYENNFHSDISLDEESTFESLNSTLTDSQILEHSGEDLNLNYEVKSHNINKKIHKKELLSRLKKAQNKMKKADDYVDDISTSFSCLEMNDNDSDLINIKNILPKFIEDDVKTMAVDIQDFIVKLEEQLRDLDNAEDQVTKTVNKVTNEIDNTYDQLICEIIEEINNKRELAKLEAQVFKYETQLPLKICRKEIKSQIYHKKQVIQKMEKMIKNFKPTTSSRDVEQLINSNRDIAGIPAVPLSDELPYCIFKKPSNTAINVVLTKISELGTVLRLGPVQITSIEEKPGSVYVKWDINDCDYGAEDQLYVLQKASGEVFDPTADVFETVYEGPETSCFVRELLVNQSITLRVGIQSLDSAWSAPRVARTKIAGYKWNQNNEDYMITNNGRVAVKINENSSILFSQGPQLDANQIIEFMFFEVPKNATNGDAIALVSDPINETENLKRNGTLMVTSQGKILMNGEEKLMQLPRLKPGGKLTFSISRKDDETLRINIEYENKAVTYDWVVITPLYFAAQFYSYNKWNIMVK